MQRTSQVISFRLYLEEVERLRELSVPGESENQTAQRFIKQVLGVEPPIALRDDFEQLKQRVERLEKPAA